jgi:hypothetical protein
MKVQGHSTLYWCHNLQDPCFWSELFAMGPGSSSMIPLIPISPLVWVVGESSKNT